MNPTHLTIEQHFRFSTQIVQSAQRALDQAEETGSTKDWLDALKTSVMIQDFAGRELIRYRLRRSLAEAASVINGDYDGQEDVSLGSWSDGCSTDDITDRAHDFVNQHKDLIS
jgi:hypothetical protein